MNKLLFTIFSLISIVLSAQSDSLLINDTSTINKTKKGDIVGFPFICYAPETGLAGGGRLAYFWKEGGSNIYTNVFLSQKLQYEIFFGGEIYKNYWKFIPKIKGSHWVDSYYGLGNKGIESQKEDYTENFFWGYLSSQRKLKNLFAGLDFDTRIEKTKILIGNPSGSGDWYIIGLGTRITYDIRDNVNYPTSGYFIESIFRSYLPINNALSYEKFVFEFKCYKELFNNVIFAVQFKSDVSTNGTPIQLMPSVGDLIRGYNQSIYKDNIGITTQMESRFPIWKKFSGTCFVASGDVYGKYKFDIDYLKIAAGAGIRYRLTDSKVNLRFDFAINRNFENSFYVDLCEAF